MAGAGPGLRRGAALAHVGTRANSGGTLGEEAVVVRYLLRGERLLLHREIAWAYVHRMRTSCDLSWESDVFNPPVLDDWQCSQTPGQDVSATQYRPLHVAGLYGER